MPTGALRKGTEREGSLVEDDVKKPLPPEGEVRKN